ncbi:MAG TPA: biotin carboxylase N-terminal domain-containing protein [Solirubrobacteraceae bacterium]|jgi:acetyl-CoA carboxylase biotin carboxylase subunit|nr:biotin carboxylase N-terminal domain-containing protein [Solirubrobacteraceae bacterium]
MRLRKVLIANRGEIALRIVRACADEDVRSVVATSEVDWDSLPARLADERVCIGPAAAAKSYLSVGSVMSAAIATGCDAIHPGYGFLSERPELPEACDRLGLRFVGPSAEAIRRGGDKVIAREIARAAGVPVGGDAQALEDSSAAATRAQELGYPLLIKAAAGGGGRGMVLVRDPDELRSSFDRASGEAQAAFGDGRVYLERYLDDARHVEVQILADAHGGVVALGDRDCSCQRRYQKVVEEAPAASVGDETHARLAESARSLARALDYVGAGTVEFLVDRSTQDIVFLEMNTRVQVEHPVTEAVTGVDIVREQLRIAAGERLSIGQEAVSIDGHAIECRLNAEDPARGFAPDPGTVQEWILPQGDGIRVDTHIQVGSRIPPHYDSLLAKLIVHGPDRASAIERTERALQHLRVGGIITNAELLRSIVRHPDFRADRINTRWLEQELT